LSLSACAPTIVDKDYSNSTGAYINVPVSSGPKVHDRLVVCIYAAEDIPAGAFITEQQLEQRDCSEETTPADAVTVEASILGRKAVHKILAGALILKPDVTSNKALKRN
jgi:hypothetical protein